VDENVATTRLPVAAVWPALLMLTALTACKSRERPPAAPFKLAEATVATIHAGFQSGEITCTQLVRMYLDRIGGYDAKGPALNAIVTVNPKAMQLAAEMDQKYKASPSSVGPLHCIPVILKDNFNTFDLPTTGGNITLKDSMPPNDAFAVKRIREAGAIILAKANLSEFARSGSSVSGLKGQTLNPYDLSRTPGGSSGGTGAAIAANFAVLGTGSDTGQSIRSPASANSLVGVRPTRGLISRSGVIPNSITQDEIGPITRTVEDAARLLDVMVGYDPADPVTALGVRHVPKSYADSLDADGLKGARLGVMMNMFGKDAVHAEVNRVTEEAIKSLQKLGAAIVRFSLPAYEDLSEHVDTDVWEAKAAFDAYMATRGPNAPAKSLADIVAAGRAHPAIQAILQRELSVKDGLNSPDYKDHMLGREKLRLAVLQVMADQNLDAIFYPHQRRLVALIGEPQLERNGTLSHGTGLPAITFPGGFSAPTATAPLGVPVGVELLGREYNEPLLLKFAFAFEQGARLRQPPASTPPLPEEK
jgi:amidase